MMRPHRYISIFTLALVAVSLITIKTADADDGYRAVLSNASANGEVRRWEITGPWGGDVRSLVVAPDNSEVFYLGTSDGQIYRSSDGARTWNRFHIPPSLSRDGGTVPSFIKYDDYTSASLPYKKRAQLGTFRLFHTRPHVDNCLATISA